MNFKNHYEKANYNAAVEYLQNKGLEITTCKRQANNLSIGIRDPKNGRRYSITKNGYIRTYVTHYYENRTYQLNPKNPGFYSYVNSRVLFPGEYLYMATLLWATVKRIRKNS